ncbi:ABC transporter ATP-binding protein [Rhizobiales bacterium L72]|uniref:ABC transporter ATP-binding protein n=2 Tax=Propylenella binzhouense TaxID=2555902 RepID=A0A964T2K2_9HYPH|nr:ABC transporter ATP-binding protein [Propylenella binzhouense]
MRGISKRFGPVQAVADVDLSVAAGDILGLLGENGAGKTSLMNVLFGTYAADAGTIEVDGRPVAIRSSADALAVGIGMVHQHFELVPRHTVLENLLVGRAGPDGRLTRAAALERLARIGCDYHLELDPDRLVGDLAIGEQQRVEIAKSLVRGARILVLDEPTATLTPREAEGLFRALRSMAARGMGVIFISHKLGEVLALTSRIAVMRHGRMAAERANDGSLSKPELARLMCGRDLAPPEKPAMAPGAPLLVLDRVSARGRVPLRDVSLALREGEIVGIAGVSGNGQRELADLVAGILPPASGTIAVAGRAVPDPSPRRMQALGIGRVPEDRLTTGMIGAMPLSESMALPWIDEPPFSHHGVLDRRAIRAFAAAGIARFDIRTSGPDARTGTLSGGNLQKALLARELARGPRILLAAQPTRGIDVGATEFVHAQFLALRRAGGAVLLVSEDLEELFALSDRIAVMYAGRIVADLPIGEASVERVGLLMAGVEERAA